MFPANSSERGERDCLRREKLRPRDFAMREALERVERHGDLFEPVPQDGQALSPALRQLRG